MTIGELAVKRPVAMLMFMCFVLLLGFVSLTNLQMDLLPKISPPVLAVVTRMPNAAPQEMSTLITEPLEAIVGTASGLKKITSHSQEGNSLIVLEFNWGSDLDSVRDELKDRIELMPLPEDATKPMVVKFDPTSMPILKLSVTGEKELTEIQRFVEDTVAPEIDSVPGVASVDISGQLTREVQLQLNEERLREFNLSPNALVQIISYNNLNLPADRLQKDNKNLPVRVVGQFEDIKELENLAVSMVPGSDSIKPIYLKDIVEIRDTYAPVSSINRTNGNPGINLSIQREGDANLVTVTQGVLRKIEELKKDGYEITLTMNQGEIVERSIGNIFQNLIIGGALAILILLVFLRSPLSTLIIAVSIPFSIVATFVLMHFAGLTLNLMTLGGLALGVGMLVDNSIVVIENIYRHLQRGENTVEAAKKGADEVAMAITASTLTTMAVFLPVVFVGGLTGEIFGELAITVAFALLASLVVALTVIPMLASIILKYRKGKITGYKEWKPYSNFLRYPLKFRLITLLITIAVFAAAMSQLGGIGREFIPEMDEGAFNINLSMPVGTKLDVTNTEVEKVERVLEDYEGIRAYSVRVGKNEGTTSGSNTHTAEISVMLVDKADREMETKEYMDKIREDLVDIDGELGFEQQNELRSMAGSSEMQLVIRGRTLAGVQQQTQRIVEELKAMDNLGEVKSNLEDQKPEIQINVDKERAILYGLTTAQIAQRVRVELGGERITYLTHNGQRIEVRLTTHLPQTKDYNELMQLTIPTNMGEITLDQVAEIKEAMGPQTIYRENQQVTGLIEAKIVDGDLGTVQNDIQGIIDELGLPVGYQTEFTGSAQLMEEGFAGLQFALILAIALVYMIMAAQFESLLNPFIIIFTMPFALIGVVLALLLSGRALGITAYIGIIMLAGIVVNNGIVMVDYINGLRREGMEKQEAIINGASVRLRPILMTALTTVLALVPLALGIGEGAEMQAPMATAVVGGLVTSTILTLIVIPVLYSYLSPKKIR